MPTIAEAFSLAERCYQAGELSEAESLFRQIVLADPNHADAHNNLAKTLLRFGRVPEAIVFCQKALSLKPQFADAHYSLGSALSSQGQLVEAIQQWEHALQFQPDFAGAHLRLAAAKSSQNKFEDAVRHCRQALQLNPHSPEAHNTMAGVLLRQGELQQAVAYCREALRLRPAYFEALNNLGNGLVQLGLLDEAIAAYREVLRINPGIADPHNGLGCALESQGKLDEASRCFREALRLRPGFAQAYNNLGNVLMLQDKPEEGIASFQQALRLQPNSAEAFTNLGSALVLQNRIDDALRCFYGALKVNPRYPSARWNCAQIALLRGEFEPGWTEYEWRWTQPGYTWRSFQVPFWDGADLNDRTILLHSEQGFGDMFQFIRYAPLVHDRGGKVIVECHPPLTRILAGVRGIERVVPSGSTLPAFDLFAPLASLPRIFRTMLGTVPATVPYLQADAGLVEHWRRELAAVDGFKVGIAWQGNLNFRDDRHRSIPLSRFSVLAEVEGVKLISLQKGIGTEQLKGQAIENHRSMPIVDFSDRLDEAAGPFMDTAAIMKNVDLVISSDTAVVHLAGALGVPVWVALPFVPDWRWMLEREDSPWYPTMRLFRQKRHGDWKDVFQRIVAELKKTVSLTHHT